MDDFKSIADIPPIQDVPQPDHGSGPTPPRPVMPTAKPTGKPPRAVPQAPTPPTSTPQNTPPQNEA